MSLRLRNGNWHYRFMVAGRTWTDDTGLAGTERNRKAASAIESEAWNAVKLGKGKTLKVEGVSFGAAAEKFLKWVEAKHAKKPNTVRRCKGSFASLAAYFDRTPVASITDGDVADYAAWRLNGTEEIKPVKPVTVRHDLHNLSKFFKYAKKHNWARENPVLPEDIPSDRDAVRINPLSPEAEARYFHAAERFQKLHDLCRLMVLQGCRPEELLGLEISHIDLERRTLRIVEGKSDAAKRTLKLRAESLSILARLVSQAEGVFVFCAERLPKQKLSLSTCENWHNKVLKASGVTCVIYDMRHTFGTRSANAGMSLATLAKVLGHASLRSVMKYVHVDQAESDRAMLALDVDPDLTQIQKSSLNVLQINEITRLN
jgi:integrase/recombinase XerC